MKIIVLFTLFLFVFAPANAQFTTNSGIATTLDKVGIGTSSLDPGYQLTVVGGINIGGEGNGSIKVRHVNGKHYESSALDHLYLNYNTGKDVYVGYGGQNSRMFVSGKIGIGTTALGSHELAVEGSIGAREIKFEASGWTDFVFEKDYKLRTLEEVESYIDENKHLPEIPSETEVLGKGINLGELNAKLLQKIEELTLYMIEINKEIKELKKENKELKSKIDVIENKQNDSQQASL